GKQSGCLDDEVALELGVDRRHPETEDRGGRVEEAARSERGGRRHEDASLSAKADGAVPQPDASGGEGQQVGCRLRVGEQQARGHPP
ncbi:MAG: hypothetical protein K0S37_2981, partial [Microbacterium sp.]|nr:hypothetical protein [Microbacterium sp.]